MGLSNIFLNPISESNSGKFIYMPDTDNANPFLRLLAYGDLTFSANDRLLVKKLDCFCTVFTLSGSGFADVEGSEYILPHSSLAIIDCSSPCTLRADNTWEIIVLYFEGNAARYFFDSFSGHGSAHIAVAEHIKTGFSEHFIEIFENSDVYAGDSLLQLKFLTSLLVNAVKNKNTPIPEELSPPDYLPCIKRLFDEEYTRPYTLDMLEQMFHINKYKIAKDFTKYYGTPPIHYLNDRRIEAAKLMLIQTNNRINEIGYNVGFETTNHFINLFKKHTSMTPAVYRKLQRGR